MVQLYRKLYPFIQNYFLAMQGYRFNFIKISTRAQKPLGAIVLVLVLMQSGVAAQIFPLSDTKPTTETHWLFSSLQRLVGAGILIGHHDDLAYGVGWRNVAERSDVKSVTGTYPALYGWDLAGVETEKEEDINSIPFVLQREYIQQVYQRGGVNTFCWHLNNPVNGKSAWDISQNIVGQIIPGGTYHQVYQVYLDRLAKYLKSLKGGEGEPIPLLFRPFHEMTGTWFWWGKNNCTPAGFISLWRYTVKYLRETKKLHNLIVVYSTADFNTENDFLERYPGDDVVDVIGFDTYCTTDDKGFKSNLDRQLAQLQIIGAKKHKLICLAETGFDKIPDAKWWTQTLLPVISKYQLSYALVWRNDSLNQFFAPYPGQVSAADFKAFAQNDHTMFQNRLSRLQVYGRPM